MAQWIFEIYEEADGGTFSSGEWKTYYSEESAEKVTSEILPLLRQTYGSSSVSAYFFQDWARINNLNQILPKK